MEQSQQPIHQYTKTADSRDAYRTLFRNVYLWMTLALVITGITSFIVASSPALLNLIYGNNFVFLSLLIGQLILVWYLSGRINTLTISSATGFFIFYSVLIGVILSSVFLVYTQASITVTFFITAGTFGAMALIGTLTKKDLSSWGSFLLMALVGIIIATIINIFLKSEAMYWAISYIGIFIFLGLTIYDANKIKKMLQAHGNEVNETTQKIALMGALSLYLDFINLFLRILRFFGNRR